MNYDRIILDLLDRITELEKDVANLKKAIVVNDNSFPGTSASAIPQYFSLQQDGVGRDKTKYLLNGVRYGKNRLVLAVVQEYVKNHPNITASELSTTFDRSLQGSLGVVRLLSDAKCSYSDCERRFFCLPNEIIRLQSEECVVCSQWGAFNIGNFITRARDLGIKITTI